LGELLERSKGTPKVFERVFDTEIRVARAWGTQFAAHDARKMGLDAKALRREFLGFFLVFSLKKCPNANKTGKNRKKPVETEEM